MLSSFAANVIIDITGFICHLAILFLFVYVHSLSPSFLSHRVCMCVEGGRVHMYIKAQGQSRLCGSLGAVHLVFELAWSSPSRVD